MKMKKLLTILLAASIVAGSAQVPGLTMQVQAAQVQTQESAGSATATYNGKHSTAHLPHIRMAM